MDYRQGNPDSARRQRSDQKRISVEYYHGKLSTAEWSVRSFLSADFPALSAFYNAETGKGYNGIGPKTARGISAIRMIFIS
jgi:hypothetical protein